MERATLLTKICRIVREFYEVDDVSILELVKSSGYFEDYGSIRSQDIATELEHDPATIQEWLQYSADKRSSNGWFFLEEDGKYVVGSIFDSREIAGRYESKVDACATFLKNELEAIRLS